MAIGASPGSKSRWKPQFGAVRSNSNSSSTNFSHNNSHNNINSTAPHPSFGKPPSQQPQDAASSYPNYDAMKNVAPMSNAFDPPTQTYSSSQPPQHPPPPQSSQHHHHHQQQQHHPQQHSYHSNPQPPKAPRQRLKLQCLVLGAAGAGKTSILRRFFRSTFEQDSRVATLGSDFYIGHVTVPVVTEEAESPQSSPLRQPQAQQQQQQLVSVNLQMWDTPGRERFYLKRKPQKTVVSLSDSFFRNANAVMLVYDMTSSTSFTQLLRWYADLLEIQKNIKSQSSSSPPFPILIVGNKLDLFLAEQQRATTTVHPRRVPQRDIMGFRSEGRSFNGQDFQYEYQVDPNTSTVSSSIFRTSSTMQKRNKKRNKKNSEAAANATAALPEHNRNRENSHETNIFFLANRENWTTDNSYLDSLINSEDASSPDRDMVLLWCLRNGLQHMECSAASGQGVDVAIQSMLKLAIQQQKEQEEEQRREIQRRQQQQQQAYEQEYAAMMQQQQQQQQQQNETDTNEQSASSTTTSTTTDQQQSSGLPLRAQHHHPEVDFQERYKKVEEPCCWCVRPLPAVAKQY